MVSDADGIGRGAVNAPAARDGDKRSLMNLWRDIEAQYTVGEYDIVILSAKQSDGLENLVAENGYRIPPGARGWTLYPPEHEILRREGEPHGAFEATGLTYLRPLQVAFS